MLQPTGRAVFLAIGGFGVALLPVVAHPRLWTLWPVYLAWLALMLGVDALLARSRTDLHYRLQNPETLYIGATEKADLNVALQPLRPVTLAVAYDLSENLEPQPAQRSVAAGQEFEFELRLFPRRRGPAQIETLWLRYTGPLGLIRHTRRISVDRQMLIVPNILPVRSAALHFSVGREFRAGMKIERFKGQGTEFDSLKEFVEGDDNRAIHWKASARHKKLLSRQYRAERNHQIILAIDSGRLMAEPLEGVPKLDHAITAALTLAYIGLRSGDRVGLFSFDAQIGRYLEPQAGVRSHAALVQLSSRVQYAEDETNFTLGLTALAQKVRRRSLIVVLTDFVDTITAELMLENLKRLARRHLVMFVALRDPQLARIAASPPVDSLELNRAVISGTLVVDREIVLRRLRRIGVLAVDTPPGQIGSRLINSYLEIKRRELI